MRKNILLVEDDMLLSSVQKRLVEQLGYSVVASVQTGQDAIEQAQQKKPDMILMDISLNGDMDGLEAMRQIRKSSSVPVIYLSGDSKWKEDKNAVPPVDCLLKPVRQKKLELCMQKAFINN